MTDIPNLAARRAYAGAAPIVPIDEGLLSEVAASLDLRRPNELALATIVHRLANHDPERGPFEAVVDAATGVGKTFIVAGSMEYLAAASGVRNFAIITPGRTILNKTVANFTPGARKSLCDGMSARPIVITSENFATPAIRAAMDDPDSVKLYVFTVQALVEPTSKASRRTRKFQEGLGAAFYDHLVALSDLVVFADEHHVYYGKKFSKAVRGLEPFALVGLTATPHPDTRTDEIIFRYPLANAIADRLVKTPVLVGRTDDLNDPATKLRDGVALLTAKVEAVERFVAATEAARINPIMLVVCEDIAQAIDVEELLGSSEFYDGRYRGAVLRITSEVPDASLAALADVEEPDSPVRVIVSVGMLKEGWDVANVYVIASLRPSISEILTEQTLGRGLRLPWGQYTDVELLDTLEVLAHERYEDLLAKAKALREELIDWRTVPRPDHPQELGDPIQSPLVASIEGRGRTDVVRPPDATTPPSDDVVETPTAAPTLRLVSATERVGELQAESSQVAGLVPRDRCGPVMVPVVEMQAHAVPFSLADITDVDPFRRLGRQLRLDPDDALRRTLVSARPVVGRDGITRIELDTRPASEVVHSQPILLAPEEARPELLRRLSIAPQVPPRAAELRYAEPLVDAFLDGLGDAVASLGAYIDRAAGALIELVAKAASAKAANPVLSDVVRGIAFAPNRTSRPETSQDRYGRFRPRVGYLGWTRAMHDENWFDSSPERRVANALDESSFVRCWARLLRGDLPILWNGMGSYYNPDFLVLEAPDAPSPANWIVEVKSERDLATFDVQAKKSAAERWAARVSGDPQVGGTWRYLLLGEVDIEAARGSWAALRALYVGR